MQLSRELLSVRPQDLGLSSPELDLFSLKKKQRLVQKKQNKIRPRDKSVDKFSLTSGFILGLLQICLGQLQVEVELNLLLLQVGKTRSEFAGFL